MKWSKALAQAVSLTHRRRRANRDPWTGEPADSHEAAIAREQDTENEAAARRAVMEAPYQAWKRGEEHSTDQDFAEIWAGIRSGFSRAYVQEHLSSQRAIIDDLQTGRRSHWDILGISVYGSTESEIIDNLRQGVVLFEEALICCGRNLSVNQTRAIQMSSSRSSL